MKCHEKIGLSEKVVFSERYVCLTLKQNLSHRSSGHLYGNFSVGLLIDWFTILLAEVWLLVFSKGGGGR